MIDVLCTWPSRRWIVAGLATLATVLVIALPTALIDNPIFGRSVPPTAWAWPVTIVVSVLSGLLMATYVRTGPSDAQAPLNRRGTAGGLLAFFAVGCPVCNKLVLLALGASGAMQWFAPVQPYLAAAGVALLVWALVVRLRGERQCPVTAQPEPDRSESLAESAQA